MTQSTSWCTNWDAYNVPALWRMIADEGDLRGWKQVQAWFRMRSAIDAYRERLEACRKALQEHWPPDRSPASAAFIAHLDGLIASMLQTAANAEQTARGLAGIMDTLAKAKDELEPLYGRWLEVSGDLTPHWWDGAEDELNAKARDIMWRTELAVRDYSSLIDMPPEHQYQGGSYPGGPVPIGWNEGNRGLIGHSQYGWDEKSVIKQPQVSVTEPQPPVELTAPPLSHPGPVLSDTPTAPTAPPVTSVPSDVGADPSVSRPGGAGRLPLPPIRNALPTRDLMRRSSEHPRTGRAVLPSRAPLSGTTSTTIPTGRSPMTQVPMPAVPPPPAGGRPGNTAPRPTAYGTHRISGGHIVTMVRDGRRGTRLSPNQSDMAEPGVAVIVPPQPRPHDPGPGIIGIDR
ncbi:MAG TPA: hypothetical protein VF174_16760 [Micromonosporaceae bacterium]